jgi:RimJ/RimL family protein N-acetyltransferase
VDLFSINWRLRSAELAMVIGNEAARGKGIGQEALGLMLGYAFGMLGLERVELEVATGNRRAIRCYEKAGMKLEGVKRHAFMVDGCYHDLAMMAILAEDWRSRA